MSIVKDQVRNIIESKWNIIVTPYAKSQIVTPEIPIKMMWFGPNIPIIDSIYSKLEEQPKLLNETNTTTSKIILSSVVKKEYIRWDKQ